MWMELTISIEINDINSSCWVGWRCCVDFVAVPRPNLEIIENVRVQCDRRPLHLGLRDLPAEQEAREAGECRRHMP